MGNEPSPNVGTEKTNCSDAVRQAIYGKSETKSEDYDKSLQK